MAEELIELGRTGNGCKPGKIRRKGYTRKDGTHVKSGCVKDTGKRGKTPASKKVLPKPKKGDLSCRGRDWSHKQPASTRRSIIKCIVEKKLRGTANSCRAAILDLNLLANFTKRTSPSTHRKARADMAWVRKQGWCRLKSKIAGKQRGY